MGFPPAMTRTRSFASSSITSSARARSCRGLLWPKITEQEAHARGIATRAREGDGKPKLNRVIRDHEDNRNCRGRGPCGECRRRVQRGDHGNLSARELDSQPVQALVLIIAVVAIVDHHVAAFDVALLGQTLSKNPDENSGSRPEERRATTGLEACCARAASGQDTDDAAAPPSSVMNSRRFS